jgi:hypothetical protein
MQVIAHDLHGCSTLPRRRDTGSCGDLNIYICQAELTMSSDEQEALKSRGQRRMRELAFDYGRTCVEIETAILVEVGSEPGALAQIAAEAFVQCRDGRPPKVGGGPK